MHAATTPVGAWGSMTIEGYVLKVSTGVRFFQDVEGDYELGVYVVENNILQLIHLIQSGTSDLPMSMIIPIVNHLILMVLEII